MKASAHVRKALRLPTQTCLDLMMSDKASQQEVRYSFRRSSCFSLVADSLFMALNRSAGIHSVSIQSSGQPKIRRNSICSPFGRYLVCAGCVCLQGFQVILRNISNPSQRY